MLGQAMAGSSPDSPMLRYARMSAMRSRDYR